VAATGTVELSAEVKAAYSRDYYIAGQNSVYFDQLAYLKEVESGQKGISYNWPMIESLQPQPTAISEYADVTPQRMTGNELSVTLQEFGSAVEVTRFVSATSYADVYEQAALVNGYSMAESVDLVARAVLGQGGRQFRQNNRATRSLYDGIGTAADRITPQWLELLTVYGRALKMPLYDDGTLLTVIHPFVFYDLLQNTGIRDLAIRTNPEILFNGELAYWAGIRICVSNNAKAFYGAGATRASSIVTTLAAPVSPGDTNIKLVSVTNLLVGQWIAIKDADEPGNVWSDTNEYFYVTAVGTAGAGGTGRRRVRVRPRPWGWWRRPLLPPRGDRREQQLQRLSRLRGRASVPDQGGVRRDRRVRHDRGLRPVRSSRPLHLARLVPHRRVHPHAVFVADPRRVLVERRVRRNRWPYRWFARTQDYRFP
jgi:N4-gp56 family major capsid protein